MNCLDFDFKDEFRNFDYIYETDEEKSRRLIKVRIQTEIQEEEECFLVKLQ